MHPLNIDPQAGVVMCVAAVAALIICTLLATRGGRP